MSKKTGEHRRKIMKYNIYIYIYIYIYNKINGYYKYSFKINKEYPTRVVLTTNNAYISA